jgi:hypothetical protein
MAQTSGDQAERAAQGTYLTFQKVQLGEPGDGFSGTRVEGVGGGRGVAPIICPVMHSPMSSETWEMSQMISSKICSKQVRLLFGFEAADWLFRWRRRAYRRGHGGIRPLGK